ncbi:MAG TPA: SDR family oxidoreductase [Micromonosporaceae bacterium]
MDLGLQGRVYLLTGASRGLGFATAQCLVDDGARVVIAARDEARLAAAVDALNAPATGDPSGSAAEAQPRAVGLAADLRHADTPERLIALARQSFGRFDGGLISVGGPAQGSAAQMTDEQWREAFETVFLGSVRLARAMLAELSEGGSVGLVLSSSARNPIPGLGLSNALRPGLAGVVKDMADEYGPRGVRVFGLLPHRILTDRNRELFAATGDAAAAQAGAEASIPLRRLGDPAEFGRVAAFLLAPAASYLTGLLVPVDGGAVRAL